MERTPGGRTIERFGIADANGVLVMEQFMMTEGAQWTIDFALSGDGTPELGLPWSKKRLALKTGHSGARLERFAIVDPHGCTVLLQREFGHDAEQNVDYVLSRANGRVVREVERQRA